MPIMVILHAFTFFGENRVYTYFVTNFLKNPSDTVNSNGGGIGIVGQRD